MRILVIAPQPFFVQRGTPIAVRALLTGLRDLGHDCDALVFAEGEDPGLAEIGLYRLPKIPGIRNVPPGFSVKKLVCDIVLLPVAARRLWSGRYDLVIAVEEAAFLARTLKLFFRVPYIYDVDSSIPEQIGDKYDPPRWVIRALEGAEGWAARGALGAITCCKALQETMARYAPDLPVQTLEDVTLIEDTTWEPPEDCQFDAPVVMYIGNLEGYQGVDLLIEGFAGAIAAGADADLVIIGGTDAHIAAHRALADRTGAGARVHLLGPRPVERIGQYLQQASIVASPRTQGRNTPMKVYSYLDSGRPLIATRLSTHTQVLDDSIAHLVEPTAKDMARGLGALLADPALRDRLAEAASHRVTAEFSPEAFQRKLTRFMEEEVVPRVTKRKAL